MTSYRRITVPGLVCFGTSALQKLLTGLCVISRILDRGQRGLFTVSVEGSLFTVGLAESVWQAQSAIAAYSQLGVHLDHALLHPSLSICRLSASL